MIKGKSERIRNGSISLVGKVGECKQPNLVLPLSGHPSQDFDHDERFLWVKDNPFELDTLKKGASNFIRCHWMISLDMNSFWQVMYKFFWYPVCRLEYGLKHHTVCL